MSRKTTGVFELLQEIFAPTPFNQNLKTQNKVITPWLQTVSNEDAQVYVIDFKGRVAEFDPNFDSVWNPKTAPEELVKFVRLRKNDRYGLLNRGTVYAEWDSKTRALRIQVLIKHKSSMSEAFRTAGRIARKLHARSVMVQEVKNFNFGTALGVTKELTRPQFEQYITRIGTAV